MENIVFNMNTDFQRPRCTPDSKYEHDMCCDCMTIGRLERFPGDKDADVKLVELWDDERQIGIWRCLCIDDTRCKARRGFK
jgi:hypothetical protein